MDCKNCESLERQLKEANETIDWLRKHDQSFFNIREELEKRVREVEEYNEFLRKEIIARQNKDPF